MEKELRAMLEKGELIKFKVEEVGFRIPKEDGYLKLILPYEYSRIKDKISKDDEVYLIIQNKLKQPKEKRYRMSNDQNAQIDCRITYCKFYKSSGTCSNISPTLTLNENKSFVCWSKEEKIEQPKDPNELIGRKVKGFKFEDAESGIAFPVEMEELIDVKGEILRLTLDEHGYVVSFKKPYHCEFTYPADQIEAHLIPEKKTKKERIEELEKRVEQLEKAVKIGMDELTKITTLRINGKIKEYEKKAPEFWYVDIVEEKDSELLPTFEEWFSKKVEFRIHFEYSYYGYSNCGHYDGYDWVTYTRDWEGNSEKMQKITLNEWNTWFNK